MKGASGLVESRWGIAAQGCRCCQQPKGGKPETLSWMALTCRQMGLSIISAGGNFRSPTAAPHLSGGGPKRSCQSRAAPTVGSHSLLQRGMFLSRVEKKTTLDFAAFLFFFVLFVFVSGVYGSVSDREWQGEYRSRVAHDPLGN